jgi:hypothetical protein
MHTINLKKIKSKRGKNELNYNHQWRGSLTMWGSLLLWFMNEMFWQVMSSPSIQIWRHWTSKQNPIHHGFSPQSIITLTLTKPSSWFANKSVICTVGFYNTDSEYTRNKAITQYYTRLWEGDYCTLCFLQDASQAFSNSAQWKRKS